MSALRLDSWGVGEICSLCGQLGVGWKDFSFVHPHQWIQGGARDASPLSVLFLSFSCSFQQKKLPITRFLHQSQLLMFRIWRDIEYFT